MLDSFRHHLHVSVITFKPPCNNFAIAEAIA